MALLLTRTPRRDLTPACPDPHQDTSGPVPAHPSPPGGRVETATEKASAGRGGGAPASVGAVGWWERCPGHGQPPTQLCEQGSLLDLSALVSPSERGEEHRRPPRVVGRSHKPAVWALHVRNVLFHVRWSSLATGPSLPVCLPLSQGHGATGWGPGTPTAVPACTGVGLLRELRRCLGSRAAGGDPWRRATRLHVPPPDSKLSSAPVIGPSLG